MKNRRIDSHHHLWRYSADQYSWMTENMAMLRHDFLVEDLLAVARESQINGTIVVQALQTIEETLWLTELATSSPLISGVIGWAPLSDSDVRPLIESLVAEPKFKGVRHFLQNEADEAFMLREDFNRGVSYLKEFKLVYDLLVLEHQLPKTLEFVDRHPNQVFVLDHIGKPQIRNKTIEPWRSHIRELARRKNVSCKISGMVTEADWDTWRDDNLRAYLDTVLEAFGAGRLMFGSDWPVLTLAASYPSWVGFLESATAGLSRDEQEDIWWRTATNVYRL